MTSLFRILIVMVAYAGCGVLSNAFAQTTEYALPLWLPAGIAIAATIAWKNKMLVGVFMGAYIVNAHQFVQREADVAFAMFLIAIPAAAVASTLGCWTGAVLGRRVLERDQSLGTWGSAITFALVIGPVAAAVSATLATPVIASTGLMSGDQQWAALLVWWKGDSLGGMLACPALLSLISFSGAERAMRVRRVMIPLALITTAIVLLNSVAMQSEMRRDMASLEIDAQRITERMRTNYEQSATMLQSTERFISTTKQPSRATVERFVNPVMRQVKATHSVAFAPVIDLARRERFERAHQSSMPYGISERDRSGNLVTAGQRNEYAPLAFSIPEDPQLPRTGFDLLSEPPRSAALRESRRYRKVVASKPLNLLSGQRGINLAIPLMNSDGALSVPGGFVVARLVASEIVRESSPIDTRQMGMIVRDAGAPKGNDILDVVSRSVANVDAATTGNVTADTLNPSAPYTLRRSIALDGRTWKIEFVPTESYAAGRFSETDWILLLSDMLLGLSTSSFVLFLAGNSMRQQLEIERRIGEVQSTERRMEQMVDAAGEAFISIDDRGLVIDWNPAAERLFGWSRDEARGTDISRLIIPSRMAEAHRSALGSFSPAAESRIVGRRVEMPAVRRDGSEITIEMLVTMLRSDETVTFHAFIHDVSERARLEEERRHATDLKTHFVAMASHEMRTPLTSIIGYAQTLDERWDSLSDVQRHKFVRVIEAQGGRLGQLVEDLLTVAQIEAGQIKTDPHPSNVQSTIEQAVEETEAAATIVCPPDTWTMMGANHLRQILTNFLRNAQKYGNPPITVRAHVDGSDVVIEVIDKGDGVPADFAPHLFEQFSQAHYKEPGKAQGVGLGLSIVKALAESYGGSAWYRPGSPRGAIFAVRIAHASSPESPPAAASTS